MKAMRKIVIYGAGGFGRETALMIAQINAVRQQWQVVGFLDDNIGRGEWVDGLPVLGGLSEIGDLHDDVSVVIAIANPSVRRQIRNRLSNSSVAFPSLIHPSVMVGDEQRNHFGEGVIVAAGNILTTNVRIHSFAIVNLACTIGHDVEIGEYASIMPACSISGSVTIEDSVELGTGAKILPGLRIGKNSRVGAGAVVTHDVPPDVTVVGVPARVVQK